MSEPVLGAAGNASSEPATFGRDGEEKPALDDRPRDWPPSDLIARWTYQAHPMATGRRIPQ